MTRTTSVLLAVAVVLLGGTLHVSAGVPSYINYQGILTNGSGNPIVTTTSVIFTIYDAATLGTTLWAETRNVSPDATGRFVIILGQAVPIADTVFKTPPCWLGTKIAADPELTPRSLLSSVPYTYRVATLDGATGGDVTGDLTILTDGVGGGAGVRDPGGDQGSFTATAAIFTNPDLSRTVSYGIDGITIVTDNSVLKDATNDTLFHVSADDTTMTLGHRSEARGQGSVALGDSCVSSGDYSTIAGGRRNVIDRYSNGGFIGGGEHNFISDDLVNCFIGGGWYNDCIGDFGVVCGGTNNAISADVGAICGGAANTAAAYGFVGGGATNSAGGDSSVIAGGSNNITSGKNNAIGGGHQNSSNGSFATVGGGYSNAVYDIVCTIAGGDNNDAGAVGSTTDNPGATVGGGGSNIASGSYASIPGGYLNTASGGFSFAAGRRGKAIHDGAFVWADVTGADFSSSAVNQFQIRCTGGANFYSNASLSTGVVLAAGGGSWSAVSDRNAKEHVERVDGAEVLTKLAEIPIARWNYISQDDSIRHIGPMAQDFYAAFGVGEDDKHITTIDADGVALAAIQALYKRNLELEAQIAELRKLIESM